MYLLFAVKVDSRSCVVQTMHAGGTARIVSPVNTRLFLDKMFFHGKLIFFFPCLIMLRSFDLNVSKFLSMIQDFVCESLIRLELEGVQNFSETFCEFVARYHSVSALDFVGRSRILSVILGILPKCTTLHLILYQMLSGFFDNMFFFKGHCWRRRCRSFFLIVVNKKLVRFGMMPPLFLHLNSRRPLRVLFESVLIRPPLLCFRFVVEFGLVSIDSLELPTILLCQAFKHVLLSIVNDFTNCLPRALVASVAQSCILSLFQAIRSLLVYSDKTFEIKSRCMSFIKTVLLKNGARGHKRIPQKCNARVLCQVFVNRAFSCKIDFEPCLFLFYFFDLLNGCDSWRLRLAEILYALSCLAQKTKVKFDYTFEAYSSSTKDSSIETLASIILLSLGEAIKTLVSLNEL